MVVVSLGALGVLMIGACKGSLVILSLGLPLGSTLRMAHGNQLVYLLEYQNHGAEIGCSVLSIYGLILGNTPDLLPEYSVGMSPETLLGNWARSLHGMLPGTLLETPLGLRFGSGTNRYW